MLRSAVTTRHRHWQWTPVQPGPPAIGSDACRAGIMSSGYRQDASKRRATLFDDNQALKFPARSVLVQFRQFTLKPARWDGKLGGLSELRCADGLDQG